jgi:hypothetical protein
VRNIGWQSLAAEMGLGVSSELIQNEQALTLEQAQAIAPEWALRWRYRICSETGQEFDITQEGLFYRSGAALEE